MDQSNYLSQTLWEYRGTGEYTDITLFCEDGSLPAHVVMLAPLFRGFGISFLCTEELPECLILPDSTTKFVFNALKALYLQNKEDILQSTIVKTKEEVKRDEFKDSNGIQDAIKGIDEKSHGDSEDTTTSYAQEVKSQEVLNTDHAGQENNETVKANNAIKQNYLLNISCNLCAKMFSKGQDYRKHMYNIHEQEEEVIWKEWEHKKFNINQKVIKENGGPKFSLQTKGTNACQYCNKSIKGVDNLNMHYALKHREEMIKQHPYILLTYPCFECDLMFLGSVDRKKHLHENHDKPWNCKACGQTFVSRKNRMKHRMEHADELKAKGITIGIKDQKCLYCHKMFEKKNPESRNRSGPTIDRHIFNVHMNKLFLHPEITSHASCNLCNTEFYSKQDLEKHERLTHSETPGPVCQVCLKVTSNESNLRSHMNVHSNETHICEICSSTFRGLVYLKRHHLKKTNLKLYSPASFVPIPHELMKHFKSMCFRIILGFNTFACTVLGPSKQHM